MAITIHDILLKYQPTVFSLGMQLRDHLVSILPNIIEMPDAAANIKTPDLIISSSLQAIITAAVAAYKQRIA
jgi:hypothetical protein